MLLRAYQRLVAFPGGPGTAGELLRVLGSVQLPGDLCHALHQKDDISGGFLRVGAYKVCCAEWVHIGRLRPLSVGLAVIADFLTVFPAEPGGQGCQVALTQGAGFVPGVAAHGPIIFLKDAPVTVHPGDVKGNEHPRVRPPGGSVHGAHIAVNPAARHDLRKTAVLVLCVGEVALVFPGHGRVVEQVAGGGTEYLRVPCPAVTLPGGAVGGQISVVVPGAPQGAVEQAVQQWVGALEPPGTLHIGVHGYGGEFRLLHGEVTLRQHISETKDSEGRVVIVAPLPADILHLLQGGGALFVDALDVSLGELSVLVQHLPKLQLYPLAGLSL